LCNKLVLLTRLYKDAQSTKHKKTSKLIHLWYIWNENLTLLLITPLSWDSDNIIFSQNPCSWPCYECSSSELITCSKTVTWYCPLSSTLIGFLRLNLPIPNFCVSCLVTDNLSLTSATTSDQHHSQLFWKTVYLVYLNDISYISTCNHCIKSITRDQINP